VIHRLTYVHLDRVRLAQESLATLGTVTIDHDRGGPVWMQLAAILRAELDQMETGAMLPSVRSLMQTYDVSDGTVKRAMRALREEGRIKTYQGRGSYKA
jgi:DNA-binding GntR family transcriptional regulator